MKLFYASFLMFLVFISSCSSDDDQQQPQLPVQTPGELTLTRMENAMVTNSNDFAFKLLQQVNSQTEGSFIVSPLSVGYVLGMLGEGATGVTRNEINHVLGFDALEQPVVNSFFANILLNAPTLDSDVSLEVANGLYVNSAQPAVFRDSYTDVLSSYYQTNMETLDFADRVAAADRVNRWCAEKSHGMIHSVVNPSSFSPSQTCLIINSSYFNGHWTTGFDAQKTEQGTFLLPDGTEAARPIMCKIDTLPYMADDQVQAISMPYGKGRYHMAVLMPVNGNVDTMLQQLSASRFTDICQAMKRAYVEVKLPRFGTTTNKPIANVLKNMGLTTALSVHADYSNAYTAPNAGLPLVSDVMHVARIEVNEVGTQASAVTSIWMYGDAGDGKKSWDVYRFYATQPFVYVIYEQGTGYVFYVGKYTGL